ncbi:VOC family protein [Streptomyces endophyticus]|uniref:Glyoxalase n=1 Tax=Streptomyces endophyticus TaxID=714166 RepID=A0ABU6FE21_9ACTN|nr:glyoxalase [Streptomyces endophyticus]MEB8342168.1 glyoxalase [Streptomyces endophyticus]
MTLVGVDHVQLAAPPGSEEVLRSFYVDDLGMTETPKPPALAARGGCWFEAGAVRLHLGIDRDFRPAKKAHPGLLARDIEAYARRLTGRGVEVEWDDLLPGRRRFYCADPVGNRLEFLEAPGLRPGPRWLPSDGGA